MRTSACHGPSGPVTPDLDVRRPPPPSWGGLTRIDPLAGLAGAARQRVHENNLRVRGADAERYAAYLEAYLPGALACRTPAELRAYGKPAAPEAGLEPGASLEEQMDFNNGPWDDMGEALFDTNEALGGHIQRLEGRPVPLEVFFDLSLTAKAQVGRSLVGGTLSSRGGAAASAGARAGGASLSATGPASRTVGLDAGVAGAEVTLSGGRVESVEVKVRPLSLLAVHTKRAAGTMEAALSLGGKVSGKEPGAPALELEARAGLGVNLLTPETVRRAISSRSFWDEK